MGWALRVSAAFHQGSAVIITAGGKKRFPPDSRLPELLARAVALWMRRGSLRARQLTPLGDGQAVSRLCKREPLGLAVGVAALQARGAGIHTFPDAGSEAGNGPAATL